MLESAAASWVAVTAMVSVAAAVASGVEVASVEAVTTGLLRSAAVMCRMRNEGTLKRRKKTEIVTGL